MVSLPLILNVLGIFLESLAVFFGLKRLFKREFYYPTTQQRLREERRSDYATLTFIIGGAFLQIIAVILEYVEIGV